MWSNLMSRDTSNESSADFRFGGIPHATLTVGVINSEQTDELPITYLVEHGRPPTRDHFKIECSIRSRRV